MQRLSDCGIHTPCDLSGRAASLPDVTHDANGKIGVDPEQAAAGRCGRAIRLLDRAGNGPELACIRAMSNVTGDAGRPSHLDGRIEVVSLVACGAPPGDVADVPVRSGGPALNAIHDRWDGGVSAQPVVG